MVLSDVKLGQGQFGVVYVGYAKHAPSQMFAVKCIDRTKIRGNDGWKCLKNEVAIMADIRNEYVV